ncbi:MAG: hypothetical protein H7A36_00285 [Chlamydiales bacterium]|nr:hypothetical protein [Chlamydiales bacterium]
MARTASKRFAISWRLTRSQYYLLLLASFLFPVFATTFFALSGNEGILWIAFLSALVGGYLAWCLVRKWESRMRRSVDELVQKKCNIVGQLPDIYEMQRGYEHQIDLLQSSVAKSKAQVNELHLEMDQKLSEMRLAYLEFEDLRKEYHRLEEEYRLFKHETQEREEQKEGVLAEYQRTIQEQRGILQKRQEYVAQLEGRVRDLTYEIRSLLQLEEPTSSTVPPIDLGDREEMQQYYLGNETPLFDLDLQLERYVEVAESFTGADHLGYMDGREPRFLDSSNSYAIDLRRLFDALRDETVGILFLFSMSEKKILFANNYVKSLLGCSPEKFVKDFPHLVKAGLRIWKEAIVKIKETGTKRVQLILLDKSGKEVRAECEMKLITKGPFINHVMGMITV